MHGGLGLLRWSMETRVVNSLDGVSFSDIDLLRVLMGSARRPSLLVDCDGGDVDEVLRQFRSVSAAPVHTCRLPGPLDLPTGSDWYAAAP